MSGSAVSVDPSGPSPPVRRVSTFLRVPVDVWICIGAAALFLPGLGAVHLFDRDEINFAEIAREMLVTGDWSRPRVGFQPFYEKPPLFMWLQATSMTVFGVTEFAARFPNAVCGMITLLVLYHVGTRRRDPAFGLLWVLAYLGSILPHLYFRSGIIDPWFNLFIFLGMYAFNRCAEDAAARQAALCGLFLGLAVLTKGPVGVVIPGACVAASWILRTFRLPISGRHLLVIVATLLGTILPWVAVDLSRNGPGFVLEFLRTHVELFPGARTAHSGFFGYHVVVLLFGCFAASLFAVREMLKPTVGDVPQRDFRRWMLLLLWAVLIAFSLVQTKVVHYSSLAYFPLTYLAALQLERIVVRQEPFGATRVAVGVIGALLALVAIAVPFLMMNTALIAPLVAADPVVRAALQASVPWTGAEALTGLWLLGVLVTAHLLHRRGAFAKSAIALFAGTALFVPIALFFFAGNIEAHSQRAAVEFFQERQGERCYVLTRSYKTYAHWFYARLMEAAPDDPVLLRGPIDRPVYLAIKITAVQETTVPTTFREIGRRNGFAFWRRDP